MEPELNLTEVRDEVLRKIGRNLYNFQKIELMLKHIISCSRTSGSINDLDKNHTQRVAAVQKSTMGSLVGQLTENIFQNSEYPPQSEIESTAPHFSISIKFEMDVESRERKKQELKFLVEDRNDLIHHLLPRFQPDSIESCLEIEDYLDKQRERLIPQHDYLISLINSMKEGMDHLTSDEYIKAFELSILQQSRLISTLNEYAFWQSRADGWAIFNHASNHLRRTLPEEIMQFQRQFGYKTLKQTMSASELFDFTEEETKNGGRRLLYRTKPEIAYDSYLRVMDALVEMSNDESSADGWALLSTAAKKIEHTLANDFSRLSARYGYQSLKELILDYEWFEIREELVDVNNARELYRVKTEYTV